MAKKTITQILMNILICTLAFTAAGCGAGRCCVVPNANKAYTNNDIIRVVVVTGGHGFEKESFFDVFLSFEDVDFTNIHLADKTNAFENIDDWNYDVIVLYNFSHEISQKGKSNFVSLLDRGVGLVAMHHSIAALKDWPEYPKIIGAKYYLKDTYENGVLHKRCLYKHDVHMPLNIADDYHPITAGIDDFTILDETYKLSSFADDNHVLITTNHPGNDRDICWVRNYKKSKVCYIQLGHGPSAYNNENFRMLLHRAIQFCSPDN